MDYIDVALVLKVHVTYDGQTLRWTDATVAYKHSQPKSVNVALFSLIRRAHLCPSVRWRNVLVGYHMVVDVRA